MIDLTVMRANPAQFARIIRRKDPEFDVDRLMQLDVKLREVAARIDRLRCEKNELAKQWTEAKRGTLRAQSAGISAELKVETAELEKLSADFEALYLRCPNLIFDDVPDGNKESNLVVKSVGEKRDFEFPVKNHIALGKDLGWFDLEVAAKMTGSNFVFYEGEAVKLVYALAMFMLKNNMKHGFAPVLPPYLINEKSLIVSSNLPKFRDQVYEIVGEDLFLTPTAEVNISNIYRDQILDADELPKRLTAWTSCFRREAGGYGANERGLIRIHQFEKVELYSICNPDDSTGELDKMIACAEDILKALGLHYRISLLAAQDCSFASAKTYDIEVWMPGQGAYYEVSSCSNCTDFQARRGKIRFRDKVTGRPRLVYTLNASSLAFPRLIVAIMETFQRADGTVEIPDVLKGEGLWA